jgi:hypothetical protein
MFVVRLDAILTDTNTTAGRLRPRHDLIVYAVARDEDTARERLYQAVIDAVAPALAFTPQGASESSALAGCLTGSEYTGWSLIYYQRPGCAFDADTPPSRMAWATRATATPRTVARSRLQVATRLVRECRIAGSLPYRKVPDAMVPAILPPPPLIIPESVPSWPAAVLVLGERSQVEAAGL